MYFDGGSTINIIDWCLLQSKEALVQKKKKFGVITAGGVQECTTYIPLRVKFDDQVHTLHWDILAEVDLPHDWILSRSTLEKLGWTDQLVKLDVANDDDQFVNVRAGQEPDGDEGPWLEEGKTYPLASEDIDMESAVAQAEHMMLANMIEDAVLVFDDTEVAVDTVPGMRGGNSHVKEDSSPQDRPSIGDE